MPVGVELPQNVAIFPAEPALAADREKLDSLGAQISALVQNFNEQERSLVEENSVDVQTKFRALLDARRVGIESIMDAWKTRAASMKIAATSKIPALGALDLSSLQGKIADEQGKLAALQTYYTSYKLAVESGNAPPPVPAELSSGAFLGISATTIITLVALAGGAWYLWQNKGGD